MQYRHQADDARDAELQPEVRDASAPQGPYNHKLYVPRETCRPIMNTLRIDNNRIILYSVIMNKVKFMDWTTFEKLVKKARRLKLNRGSDINVWSLDALKLYPIVLSIPHNEGAEMRCQVALEDGSSVFLDILPKDFGKLKSVNIPA
tara:strand:- start:46 stop:486 length:441 start_codon:yes stop_codon:yes gene_type:complete